MRRQAGFTLIEMIVVIVIMGLVAGLVLVRQPLHSAGMDAEATVRALTSALRSARTRAIVQGRDVAVTTDTGGFTVDGGLMRLLPPGEALTAAQVVFTPEGGSSGRTLLLTAGTRRIVVSIDWLTGRVVSREVLEQ